MKKLQKYYPIFIASLILFIIFPKFSYPIGKSFNFDITKFVDLSNPPQWIHGFSLILLSCNDVRCANEARDYIVAKGGTIAILSPPHAMVGWVPPEIVDKLIGYYGIETICFQPINLIGIKYKNIETIALINFFNYVTSGELELDFFILRERGYPLINDVLEPPLINYSDYLRDLSQKEIDIKAEISRLKPQASHSPGNSDSMKGTVACCLFFIESDGSIDSDSFTWSSTAVSHTYNQCASGLSWWANKAKSRGIDLSFTLYYYPPDSDLMKQSYEPIYHSSGDDYLWINSIMSNLGITSGSKFMRVGAFNTWLRGWATTNWAFSVFIGYNPPEQGASSRFTDNKFAYAYLGGPYTQILYKNDGWSLNDNWSVLAHESGHIFWACDEYYEEGYGGCTSCDPCNSFRPITNGNCIHPNCNPYNSKPCMMRYNENAVCSYTEKQIGWFSDVQKEAHIELDKNSLFFTGSVGQSNLPPQIFKIRNSGKGQMNYQISVNNSWLSVSPSNGSSTGEWDNITTSINMSGLGPGNYTGTISVTSGDADNSPQNLTAYLTVLEDQPPSVSITSPQNGDFVNKTITIKANASDDKGVTKVEFYIDNALKGTDTSPPYEWSWDTTNYISGIHNVKARAYDTLNQTAEHTIQVTVDQPPNISITSPSPGSNVYGIVTIKTSVSDDFGINKVQFYVNDGLSKTSTESPYIFNWETNNIFNGQYTMKAVVYDTRNQTAQDQINLIRIPHAPMGFTGRKENNSSVLLEQYINVLTWKSNDLNRGISKYRIYQKEGDIWALLAEVNADTFEYWHLNVAKDEKYIYIIKAVDGGNREGESAYLEVQ